MLVEPTSAETDTIRMILNYALWTFFSGFAAGKFFIISFISHGLFRVIIHKWDWKSRFSPKKAKDILQS